MRVSTEDQYEQLVYAIGQAVRDSNVAAWVALAALETVRVQVADYGLNATRKREDENE